MALPYSKVNFVDGTTPLNAATLDKLDQGIKDLDDARLAGGGGIPPTLIDAKGDLIVGSAPDTAARLPVGADGLVPIADASQALGVRWGPRAAGIPVNLSVVSGGAYWSVAALANFNQGMFFLPDGGTTWAQGIVYIPAGVTAVRLRVVVVPIVATGGNVVMGLQLESVSDGGTINNFNAVDLNQTVTVALASTAWISKHQVSNLVSSGVTGGDLLQVRIIRLGGDAADTYASTLGLLGAWLELS